jgi:hypothetical protein
MPRSLSTSRLSEAKFNTQRDTPGAEGVREKAGEQEE